ETADEEVGPGTDRAPVVATAEPLAAPPPSAAVAAPPASAPVPPRAAPPTGNGNGHGFLSPVVKALLAEHGLAPGDVHGTGRDGRVTGADVVATAAARRAMTGAPMAPAVAAPSPSGGTLPYPPVAPAGDDEVVEFTRARRATAEHMVRSLATSAHTLVGAQGGYPAAQPARAAADP